MNGDSHALLIDFVPNANNRIGFVEIINIHLYTYGEDESVFWSPMMLELRSVFYRDYKGFTPKFKEKTIKEFKIKNEREKIIEFLYLNGDDYSWNWGKNGMTNAAFLDSSARKYFKHFFD
jgi:hypothetical protein